MPRSASSSFGTSARCWRGGRRSTRPTGRDCRAFPGIRCLDFAGDGAANYAYFPILVGPDYPIGRDALYDALKRDGIHPRRYFYPLISDHAMYRTLPSARREDLPVASAAADRVLCLPIYPDLDPAVIARIVRRIAQP